MGRKQLSTHDAGDVIWVCRHLAAALQGDATILQALDKVSARTPARIRPLLSAMRTNLVAGSSISDELSRKFPGFVWGPFRSGEVSGTLGAALTLLADELEAEQSVPAPKDPRLFVYGLAFGRLGMLFKAGVPVLQALEAVAESASDPVVRDAFASVQESVKNGGWMWRAFAEATDDLPPMVIEIIRDAEGGYRLDDAISIAGDYCLDEAGAKGKKGGA